MVKAVKRGETVHIRGTPPNLSAVLRLSEPVPGPVPASLDLPKKALEVAPLSALVSLLSDVGVACFHLRVPRTTPPGTYRGTVEIEDQRKPLVVEVEPRTRIRILPKRATIQSRPGKRAELKLTLINLGNVAFEVPKASGFGLYDKEGMDSAIGSAFLAELGENERRIDRVMEELREGHGGVVRLKVQKGAGKLEPGDARDLAIVFQVPARVVPGRSYWGLWTLHGYNFEIEIQVVPENDKTRAESRKS